MKSSLPPRQFSLAKAKRRIIGGGLLFTLLIMALAVRVGTLALVPEKAIYRPAATAAQYRADIVDSNGTLLATTLKTVSLYADPKRLADVNLTADRLSPLLGASKEHLAQILAQNRRFVWLRRHISPRLQKRINDLGLPGLFFRAEKKRVYPHRNVAAHVLGFTDIDLNGLAGIERFFDERLGDSREPLVLSLDIRLQHILHSELRAAMSKWRAKAAVGVILNAENNEILSLVSLPDFDPNRPGYADRDQLFNRASLGVYELGSPFKLFTAALALEGNTATFASKYDATHPLAIGNYRIRDFRPKNEWLTLPQVLQYSSNIGAAQMALEAGAEAQEEFLAKFGILEPLQVELERGNPALPRRWRRTEVATIAYGHGLAVTPLHLASAVGALVNGGIFYQPSLIKNDSIKLGIRSMAEDTSTKIASLMRLVVEHGSGRSARVEGVAVGGKTGTAIKLNASGSYDRDAVITSFVAAFPLDKPKYIVLTMLDEPAYIDGKPRLPLTGGRIAAPIGGNIIRHIAAITGITGATEAKTATKTKAETARAERTGGVPQYASFQTP